MPDPTRTAASAPPPSPTRDSAFPRGLRAYHWLAALPTVCLLAGIPFVNRVHPTVFGFPLLMAWIVFWVVVTSAVMALILRLDHRAEREHADRVRADRERRGS